MERNTLARTRDAAIRRSGRAWRNVLLAITVASTAAAAGASRTVQLAGPVARIVDGDTFDADLDGNGRVEVPAERVRLLYVDTPELRDSPKGEDKSPKEKNLAHGLPAKAALTALLKVMPVELAIPTAVSQDSYGRTLARVTARGEDVSLALVRAGHSPFDTRFSFPEDYGAFTAAEAEAFDAKRGIWADAPSRKRYLDRLRDEGRTPQSTQNPRFVPGIQPVDVKALKAHLGKYVTVKGNPAAPRRLGSGAMLFGLRSGSGAPLTVFASRSTVRRLPMEAWRTTHTIRAEGFVQTYNGVTQLLLHYARIE